jgi:kinesin family protein C2/C3
MTHPPHSHQILTVIVDGFSHVTGSKSHGCLHLIDLAGSERVGKSEASGAWLPFGLC